MEPVVNVAWSPMLLAAANNVPANSVAELVAVGKSEHAKSEFRQSRQRHAAPPRRRDAAEGRRLHHDQHSLQGNVGIGERSAGRTDTAAVRRTHGGWSRWRPRARSSCSASRRKSAIPLLPNVPAISETFPQFKIISYIGFMLPKNTPAAGDRGLEQGGERGSSPPTRCAPGWTSRAWSPSAVRRMISGARSRSTIRSRGELVRALGITGE